MALFALNDSTIRVEKWLFNEIEDIDATLLLIGGGMVFEGGIHVEIEVIETERLVDKLFEEKIIREGRIGSRIDGDGLAFKWRKEIRH